MAAVMMKSLCVVLLSVFATVSCDVTKRTVTVKPWPDCNNYKSTCDEAKSKGSNIVYVKATSPEKNKQHDNLYYAFSTIGLPTIVYARVITNGGVDSDMQFDWDKLVNQSYSLDDAITFTNSDKISIVYKFGVAFTKLIEYDDASDSADLKEWEKHRTTSNLNSTLRDFGEFQWDPVSDKAEESFVFNTTSDSPVPPSESHNGSLSFTFKVLGSSGRSTALPSLKYGANETMFNFLMSNYTPSYDHSRFALEVVVVSLSTYDKMEVDETESIDDEYSPGVFQIVNWLSNPKDPAGAGFFQWKPVSYLSKTRGRKTATKVKYYDLYDMADRPDEMGALNKTLVRALFGQSLTDKDVLIRTTNISFGLPKDGFYVQNNYTEWTAAIGYGTPPADAISTTVIIIISAGLGLPVLIIIFGGLFTCVKKMKRRSEYQPITPGTVSRSEPMVN